MKASAIIDAAADLLLDPDHAYWGEPELLEYVDEAQRVLGEIKPDALTTTTDHQLTDGVRQTLPADARYLIDVPRNRGLTGEDDGPPITAVERRVLDRMAPGWTSETPSRTVIHYCYEPRDPRAFAVYPPQPLVAGIVELIYVAEPTTLSAAGDDLTVGGQYRTQLIDYVLYRAHTKDTSAAVPARAQAHYQAFLQGLGATSRSQGGTTAGTSDEGGPR